MQAVEERREVMEQSRCNKCGAWDSLMAITNVYVRVGDANLNMNYCQSCLGRGPMSDAATVEHDGQIVDRCIAAIINHAKKGGAS